MNQNEDKLLMQEEDKQHMNISANISRNAYVDGNSDALLARVRANAFEKVYTSSMCVCVCVSKLFGIAKQFALKVAKKFSFSSSAAYLIIYTHCRIISQYRGQR